MPKLTLLLLAYCLPLVACAQSDQDPDADSPPSAQTPQDESVGMSAVALIDLVRRIDPQAVEEDNSIQFTFKDRPLLVVHHEAANRMRIVTPIASADDLPEDLLLRMLQANYDAVLDVRYAIANELVWAAYLHPLAEMSRGEFLSGVAQVVTAADTFGTTFTSGALVYGGGDSNEEHDKLFEELERRLQPSI